MPSPPTSPLPTPAPAPRRPPVPAGILRAIAVLAVVGLAFIFSRGSENREIGGETPAIAFDASFPAPLLRAAVPLADGFALPVETASAAASGIVITADPERGVVVLLHKLLDDSGAYQYFNSYYDGVRGLYIAVGDPVARAQKLAESGSNEVSILALNADGAKNSQTSIGEFLRNHPLWTSPKYAIPPFSAHGGRELPIISQPQISPQTPENLESP